MRVSRKFQLVSASAGSVLLLTLLLFAGLTQLARWGETKHDVYPWRYEDYLRYLVPSLHLSEDAPRMLLVGPSEMREDLVHHQLASAFPAMNVYQGGQSLGTLDQTLLALDYLEQAFGPSAVPQTLVLGLTPRFVANLPAGTAPLVTSIDSYSPYFRVEPAADGPHLVRKSVWAGIRSRKWFLSKQGARYRAAFAGLCRHLLGDTTPYEDYDEVFAGLRAAESRAPAVGFMPLLSYARAVGPRAALAYTMRLVTSPYRYHHLSPVDPDEIDAWLRHPDSFWYDVHHWDPNADAERIRLQCSRLLAFAERHGVRVFAVNLPEHPLNSALYDPAAYAAYLDIIRTALPGVPVLDLRDAAEAEGFFDAGHLNLPNALRVTDRTITFITAHCEGTLPCNPN